MTTARLAYLNARMRARKARLLGRDDIVRLAAAENVATAIPGWRDLDPDGEAAGLVAVVYRRLIVEYATAWRACPPARAALAALLQFHEVENVKLPWRAITRRRPAADWLALWRPLEPLATVARDACREATTLRSLVALLKRTPYGEAADAIARAHELDLEAAEIAFDRWTAAQLESAIATVPTREVAARALLQTVADARQAAVSARAAGGVQDVSPAMSAVHARRRTLMRRALQGTPYCLAPLFAYLLAREDEACRLLSLGEARARRIDPAAAGRMLGNVM